MKIYHKKNFAFGLWALLLAALNLTLSLWQGRFDWKYGALTALLLLLGGAGILRSLSLKWSREDRTEEQDERNRLVKLKARSLAYEISQFVCLMGAAALCAWGKQRNAMPWVYGGLGLLAAFFASLLADFFTWIYFDEHT